MSANSMRYKQPPFTIYSDYTATIPESSHEAAYDDDQEHEHEHEIRYSMSPSPYDADNGLSSDENESIIHSIESPSNMNERNSSAAFTTISSIPPSLPVDSDISPYTPQKAPRAAFRTPSSVRAMQMASPPPFASPRSARMESPHSSSARRHRAGTPSSVRSGSILHRARHSQHLDDESSIHGHGSGRNTPQQPATRGPLVLLHVTVLPCPGFPYSVESLQDLAPEYVLRNWSTLQEKLTETVLSRGILIPHPGEEFDLLEEGLLETLGLCTPRIGSCGHFHGGEQDSDSDSGNDSAVSDLSGSEKNMKALCRTSHRSSDCDGDICHECDQPMRVPGKGIGSGNVRWDIKIYAANGLMKAGAWGAAWREMERVDVEIEPWIPEQVRRALDLRLAQDEEKHRQQHEELEKLTFEMEIVEKLRREAEEDKQRAHDERRKAEQRAAELEKDLELAKTAHPLTLSTPLALIESIPKDELVMEKKRSSTGLSETKRASVLTPISAEEARDIPLSTLLRNYILLLAQDKRNVGLAVLSAVVILLALRLASSPQATAFAIPDQQLAHPHQMHSAPDYSNTHAKYHYPASAIEENVNPEGRNVGSAYNSRASSLGPEELLSSTALGMPIPSGSVIVQPDAKQEAVSSDEHAGTLASSN